MTDILQDFSTPAIISAIESNFYAQQRIFASLPDIEQHDEPDVTWSSSSRPLSMFNKVLNIRFTADEADAKIDTLLAHFQSHSRRALWWIGPGTQPTDLGRRLVRRGLTEVVKAPGMALNLQKLNEDVPVRPDLVIEPVKDLKTLRKWTSVYMVSFDFSVSEIKAFFETYAHCFAEQFPMRHYIGWLNRKPVATATLFLSNGVAGLYNVGTHPATRVRGIGRTISLATLREARSMGYRMSILQSTSMGFHLYRQLGFQEHCTISGYMMY